MVGPANLTKLQERHVQRDCSPAGGGYCQSMTVMQAGTRTGYQAGRRQGRRGPERHMGCYSPCCWVKALAEGFLTGNDRCLPEITVGDNYIWGKQIQKEKKQSRG